MSTTIKLPSQRSTSLFFTSEFSDVTFTTDADTNTAVVKLTCGGTVLLSTELYVTNSSGSISDLADLIEAHLRASWLQVATYTLTVNDASVEFTCIYCDYTLPFNSISLENNFLTLIDHVETHTDSSISLSALTRCSGYCLVKYIVDDTPYSAQLPDTYSTAPNSPTTIKVADLLTACQSVIPGEAYIVSFTFVLGERMKTFYLDRTTPQMRLMFTNVFNAMEYLDVVGTVVTKTKSESDSAVIGGVTTLYNRVVNRTYEVTTGAMPRYMAEAYSQLFSSRFVALIDSSSRVPATVAEVIITDSTLEPTTDNETLFTVKFTWRFADRRPRVLASEVEPLLSSVGVFSTPFTQQYS